MRNNTPYLPRISSLVFFTLSRSAHVIGSSSLSARKHIKPHFHPQKNSNNFSSINSLEAMSKRKKKDASKERVTAKLKPMMNLVSRCCVRDPNVLATTASESPGENQIYKSESTSKLME